MANPSCIFFCSTYDRGRVTQCIYRAGVKYSTLSVRAEERESWDGMRSRTWAGRRGGILRSPIATLHKTWSSDRDHGRRKTGTSCACTTRPWIIRPANGSRHFPGLQPTREGWSTGPGLEGIVVYRASMCACFVSFVYRYIYCYVHFQRVLPSRAPVSLPPS
jgi:hypothetical protein